MHLYGEHHEFESGPRPEGGYAVRITIPFRLGRISPPRNGDGSIDEKLATAVQS
jgi:hypothetical protein